MEVTHVAVGEVIEHIFSSKPYITDDFVGFGLAADYFKAEVIVSIFDTLPETADEPVRQGMQMWVWFRNPDESRMNLRKFTWPQVLELCHRLQDEINWGTLAPSWVNDDEIQIALFRSIDITLSDIGLALNRDLHSEFLRTLARLSDEWEELSPVFMGVETGQITSVDGVELLLQAPASYS